MEQMDQSQTRRAPGRLVGSLVLAAAIVVGCIILANAFARHYYSSGGYPVPSSITARIDSVDSGYLPEGQAVGYIGLDDWVVWERLIGSGALDGTYVTFEATIAEGEADAKEGVIRVFSKARLDEWMQAKFAQ